MPIIILLDNGSIRANATLQLRQLANDLSKKIGHVVHPVSCKHSDRIPASEIGGKPAQIFREFMTQQLSSINENNTNEEPEYIVLPLFFGKSRALTSFIPDEIEALKKQFGDFKFEIAQVLYPLPEGDKALTQIIYDHVISSNNSAKESTNQSNDLPLKNLVLVDHGSPVPRVTAVRKHLAQSVQDKLPNGVVLEEAVMERREGKEYDFNGDLLEDWLSQKAQAGETCATVILMFFLPGRHAGEGGDIVEICNNVMEKFPDFRITISPLITEHPELVSILSGRLKKLK